MCVFGIISLLLVKIALLCLDYAILIKMHTNFLSASNRIA